jgi:raffinose/stachyose/melibiose transport system permease protein
MKRAGIVAGAVFLFLPVFASSLSALEPFKVQQWMVPWSRVDSPGMRALAKYKVIHPEARFIEASTYRLGLVNDWSIGTGLGLVTEDGPELLAVGAVDFGRFVRQGLLQQVDELYRDRVQAERWPAAMLEALKVDGHYWGAVNGIDFGLLAGNPSVFSSVGLRESDMPRKWSDIPVVARRLGNGGFRSGFGVREGQDLGILWAALAKDAGGVFPVQPGPGDLDFILSDTGIKAGEELVRLARDCSSGGGGTLYLARTIEGDLRKAFITGKVGMALVFTKDVEADSYWMGLYDLKPFLAPVPGPWSGGAMGLHRWSMINVVPAFVRDPVRKKAICDYYLAVTESGVVLENEALGMATNNVMRIPLVYMARQPHHKALAFNKIPSSWPAAVGSAFYAVGPMPNCEDWLSVAGDIGFALAGVIRNGGDVRTAFVGVHKEYERRYHQAGRMNSGYWMVFAWLLLAVFVLALLAGSWKLWQSIRGEYSTIARIPERNLTTGKLAFSIGLLVPPLAVSFVFTAFPFLSGFTASLRENVSGGGGEFVGMRNYLQILVDPGSHEAVGNTVYFLAISFVLEFIVPLLLALGLSAFRRGSSMMKSALFLPAVSSTVVVGIVWQQMFAQNGWFNIFVELLGFPPRIWLSEAGTAMFAVVLAKAWSTAGMSMMVYSAAMAAVPESLYEETEIAGGGLSERFLHVTLPYIWPVLGIGLIGWLISSVRTIDLILLMTGGGPGTSTTVLGMDIFMRAYGSLHFGYAMAEVWLLVAVAMLFSVYQLRGIRQRQLNVMGA